MGPPKISGAGSRGCPWHSNSVQQTGLPGSMVSTPINLDPKEEDSGNPIELDREEEGTVEGLIEL